MSLDVVLLNSKGFPERAASIGVDCHHRMVQLLGKEFPLLHRMSDYYEDASYTPEDILPLRHEVLVAQTRVEGDADLHRFIREVLEILGIAAQRSCGVVVIAD